MQKSSNLIVRVVKLKINWNKRALSFIQKPLLSLRNFVALRIQLQLNESTKPTDKEKRMNERKKAEEREVNDGVQLAGREAYLKDRCEVREKYAVSSDAKWRKMQK